MWGRFARPYPSLPISTEYLTTPDGEVLEIHSLSAKAGAPRVLLLHGLEGSVKSHYVGGVMARAHERGWGAVLMIHRGCGSAPNVARRFYHSGETSDAAFVFGQLSARWPGCPWLLVGISLGGNVLLKWLGETAEAVDTRIKAAVAISVPFDLEAGARKISRGFARVYDRTFLRTLRRKALAKLVRYPDLFSRQRLARARSVYDFDDAVTAPVHGFVNASDYYSRSSSLGFLSRIRVRTLLISARDDPFLPRQVLDLVESAARSTSTLSLEFSDHGGHVGFISGPFPWRPFYHAEWRAFRFFDEVMEAVSP